MQKHYFPNTKAMQLEFLNSQIIANESKLQLGVVNKNNNLMSGVISLNSINYINRSCEISIVMGSKSARTLRYFIESINLICKHAFETLNMNRIYSGTIAKEVDQLFCRIFGFKHEGISRQAVYKNGKYCDIYHHSLLEQEYNIKNEKV